MAQRLNYNTIAHRYDAHPDRRKQVDQDLLAFIQTRPNPCVLDIGCGTGTQLTVNQTASTTTRFIGLDYHIGMLHHAQQKTRAVLWIQGTGEELPFPEQTFDYVTIQFAFHHINDKPQMLAEVFRILKPGGRFVMANICPQEMRGWYVYRYFPSAYQLDLQDFMPHEYIRQHLSEIGYSPIHQNLSYTQAPIALKTVHRSVDHLDPSQCHIISSLEYQSGMANLEREVENMGPESTITNEVCILRISADKPNE